MICVYCYSAVQYAGFTVTPLFGSFVSYLGYHYPLTTKLMYIDEYSVPALFMGGLAALLALAFASFEAVTSAVLLREVEFSVPRCGSEGDEIESKSKGGRERDQLLGQVGERGGHCKEEEGKIVRVEESYQVQFSVRVHL